MSLGAFVLRNIYTPLQLRMVRRWGPKRAAPLGLLALLASWMFVGIWHRFSGMFLLYGLGMALLLWVEKLLRDRILMASWSRHWAARWAWALVGPLYVFVAITLMLHLLMRELIGS